MIRHHYNDPSTPRVNMEYGVSTMVVNGWIWKIVIIIKMTVTPVRHHVHVVVPDIHRPNNISHR